MSLERWPKFDSGDDNEPIVAVRWKTAKTCSEVETPSLAVIWKASCMTLTRGVNDESNFKFPCKMEYVIAIFLHNSSFCFDVL